LLLRGRRICGAIGILRSVRIVLRVGVFVGVVGGFQKRPFELAGSSLWRCGLYRPALLGRLIFAVNPPHLVSEWRSKSV